MEGTMEDSWEEGANLVLLYTKEENELNRIGVGSY